MKKDEKLAQLAAGKSSHYSIRKQALDAIIDKDIICQLAENAKDDWIRLEAAIISKNNKVLKELRHHRDERIQLESAIELNDQEVLTKLVLKSKEYLHREIALRYITKKDFLHDIAENSIWEKDRIEAALMYRDRLLLKKLFRNSENDELKFRIAQYINDFKLLKKLAVGASNKRVRKMAGDLADDFDPDSDID